MLTDEEGRIGALHRHGILGLARSDAMDRVVRMAQTALGAPIAAATAIERSKLNFLALSGAENLPVQREQSFCATTIMGSAPLVVEDAQSDSRFVQLALVGGLRGIRSYLGVPLRSRDGYNVGTICVMDTRPRIFTAREIATMVDLADLAMSLIGTRQPDSHDYLTGAMTRRRFQIELEREFERATRYERPAALVFLDIDRFGEINAGFGAELGDEIIKAVANHCLEAIRVTDILARVGGEEFALLLPETLAYEASQCAERIRETLAKLRFRSGGNVMSITASFGVAALNPQIRSAVQWFAQADIALYAAKQAGRNCVAFAPPAEQTDRVPLEDPVVAEFGIHKLH